MLCDLLFFLHYLAMVTMMMKQTSKYVFQYEECVHIIMCPSQKQLVIHIYTYLAIVMYTYRLEIMCLQKEVGLAYHGYFETVNQSAGSP